MTTTNKLSPAITDLTLL